MTNPDQNPPRSSQACSARRRKAIETDRVQASFAVAVLMTYHGYSYYRDDSQCDECLLLLLVVE